jgi:protein TonB
MSKLNIFNRDWIDIVFEGRNKKYGAYQLRAESPKTTVRALIAGAILFTILVAIPIIYRYASGLVASNDDSIDKVIEVVDLPPPPVEEPLPVEPEPPKPQEVQQAPKSVVDEVKFKDFEIKKKEQVVEEPPKTTDFVNADPSSRTEKGSPTGDIVIDKPAGDLDKGVEAPDNTVYNTAGLQVQPEFPGGIAAFLTYVQRNFRIPEVEQNMVARIYVSFVVEKDGTLTDIKVTRDPGYGMGKEAERVLRSVKTKWSPGIQNGKPVRARYNLPITINIKE